MDPAQHPWEGPARPVHHTTPGRGAGGEDTTMAKHGKKYREVAAKVDRDNLYTPLQGPTSSLRGVGAAGSSFSR